MPETPKILPFLDQRLAQDTFHIGTLELCHILLMNDARFPWLILVPQLEHTSELTDLDQGQAATLMDEIRLTSYVMQTLAKPDKINVATLGNIVSQLHIHVVGRFLSDPAWPNPVWGFELRQPYPPHAAQALIEKTQEIFVTLC